MKNKIIIISVLFFFLPWMTMAEDVAKGKANQVLHKEIFPHMKVKALQNGYEISEKNQDNAVVVETVSYAGLEDFNNASETVINFSGSEVTVGLPVYVYFSLPNKLEKYSIANQDGEWQINMPINVLPSGQHTAYLQAEIEGVRSDPMAVASLKVSAAREISSKTWFFIFFVALAIVILLFAIILQLRRNANDLALGQFNEG